MPDPRPLPGKIANKLPSKPFSGEAYRHVCEGKDGTDSSRSKIAGGRWNPSGEFEALYLALSEEGAVGEFIRYVGYPGSSVTEKGRKKMKPKKRTG